MAYNRYIYRILPAEVNSEEIPIRLQFTDDDGTFMTSDDFAVSLDDLFHVYDMTIYAGDLNQKLVKAVLTVNDAETEYDATVESGELTVRGVTDNAHRPRRDGQRYSHHRRGDRSSHQCDQRDRSGGRERQVLHQRQPAGGH